MHIPPSDRSFYTRRHALAAIGAGLFAAAVDPLAAATSGTPVARAGQIASPPPAVRRIRHALGETDVPASPARVVTLFQGATDTAVSLGVHPVGVVESWTQKPIYPYLRTALGDVAQVGLETQPSLEDMVFLAPDLIVASRFRNERIYNLLSRIAPTIALDDVYSFPSTLALMGAALDRQAHAQTLWAEWSARAARLQRALATTYGSEWPLTVSVLDFREDHVRAYLPNSFSGRVLNRLGFARTPYQADPSRTLEKITSREAIPFLDAKIIFILMRSDRPSVRENVMRWRGHPLWARLDAARHDRVYEVDNVAWSLSGGIIGAGLMLDEITQTLGLDS